VKSINAFFDRRYKVVEIKDYTNPYLKKIIEVDRKEWGHGGVNYYFLSPVITNAGYIIILLFEKNLAGYAIFISTLTPFTQFLFDFVLLKQFRGKKLAPYFLASTISLLNQCYNVKDIQLTVSPENKSALHIYKGIFGMKLEKKYLDYYGKDEHRYLLNGNIASMLNIFKKWENQTLY